MGNENEEEKKDIQINELPQSEAFKRTEVYQHKQTADAGKALVPEEQKEMKETTQDLKEEEKTSKEEGLNQVKSAGDAGAFEGFEDQQKAV